MIVILHNGQGVIITTQEVEIYKSKKNLPKVQPCIMISPNNNNEVMDDDCDPMYGICITDQSIDLMSFTIADEYITTYTQFTSFMNSTLVKGDDKLYCHLIKKQLQKHDDLLAFTQRWNNFHTPNKPRATYFSKKQLNKLQAKLYKHK